MERMIRGESQSCRFGRPRGRTTQKSLADDLSLPSSSCHRVLVGISMDV